MMSGGEPSGEVTKGDVLVSHLPPKNLLDRTYSGVHAGDEQLRSAVKKKRSKPALWLFGHIHEGAGAARPLPALLPRCSRILRIVDFSTFGFVTSTPWGQVEDGGLSFGKFYITWSWEED